MIRTQRSSAPRWVARNPLVMRMTRAVFVIRSCSLAVVADDSAAPSARANGSAASRPAHDFDEAFRKRLRLPGGQRGLVLNGVRDAAQEIGIAHHVTKRAWKLRNRERKRAGHALQHPRLIGEVTSVIPSEEGAAIPDACPIFLVASSEVIWTHHEAVKRGCALPVRPSSGPLAA